MYQRNRRHNRRRGKWWVAVSMGIGVCFFIAGYVFLPDYFTFYYTGSVPASSVATALLPEKLVRHQNTPPAVKAIYLTSWVAGHPARRSALVRFIEETELNAVVIDIKDYTGRIAFTTLHPLLTRFGASESRIPDVAAFIDALHEKGIYVIGRISVFQDPHLVTQKPEWAVMRASDRTRPWADYKGLSWLDPGARPVWDYVVALGEESHELGFDELNFDYVRFPSDGDMADIAYPLSGDRSKREVLREFFAYLTSRLKESDAVLSIDLFGMTTTNTDDLNIGQVFEDALSSFDYVSPMVYPSHYPRGFNGYSNPAAKPYEVVRYSLDQAWRRASSTPQKIRPWLQDFDLGATYTAEMVRSQIQATYDAGFTSWMLWDPANIYTKEAVRKE